VPRKPLFENRVFVGFVIEKEHAKLIEAIARREGVSKSELCRRIIIDWLQSPETRTKYGLQLIAEAKTGEASVPADLPVDPLEQLEAEEFFSELEKFEREVEELEKVVKAVASRGGGPALKPHLDHFRRQAWRKIERWHSLRRLYARCRNAVPPQKRWEGATRLVETKRTLNALLELLR